MLMPSFLCRMQSQTSVFHQYPQIHIPRALDQDIIGLSRNSPLAIPRVDVLVGCEFSMCRNLHVYRLANLNPFQQS